MHSRRVFLACAGGLTATSLIRSRRGAAAEAEAKHSAKVCIEDVRLLQLTAREAGERKAIYVEVAADNGLSGLHGPLMEEQAFIIAKLLKPAIIGLDALATEAIWETMRKNRHSRSGQLMMAVSAVDIALWDLKGKHLGLPVYRLLGGPTRERIPVYASMLGHSVDPSEARKVARDFFDRGFTAQKWFFRYGPRDGADGKRKNIGLIRALREELGGDAQLMFDGLWAWDTPYSLAMAREMVPFNPTWLEEPVRPEHIEVYRQLKRDTGIPLAAGEHLYTRWNVKQYLDADVLSFVQADPEWTGGITELVKICALAETYGVPVIPHGHHIVPALHVVASQTPRVCPMAECLMIGLPNKQYFQKEVWQPADGHLPLPTGVGLGVSLDEAKIGDTKELTWE